MIVKPTSPFFGRRPLATAGALLCLLLASCGGGGGDSHSDDIGGTSIGLPPSSSLAKVCAAPRPATAIDPFTGTPYGDTQGSLDDEKRFLRSWIDETYLWYRDVRDLPAATLDRSRYPTPQAYFAALRSPLTTPSGKPKDEFHFTYDTPTWVALAQSGVAYGYGFEVALLSATVPRSAIVAFTQPGTPATANGIARGAAILAVDGVDVETGNDTRTINAGLFPTAPGPHTLLVRDLGATTSRSVTLTAAAITEVPVQNVKTLPAPNASVGYMLFNDHIATSEAQLAAAISQLKAAAVTDLVIDIRYNGGGYLDIAAALAYMVAGPTNTAGKFFERLSYNDRNPFNLSTADATTDFHATGQFGASSGLSLPTLGLSRVYLLTSADTCSASEAIINGLRGAGVEVRLIGGTTCGKPYGFYPKDNCGTTYFAIQFKGVNNVGFGDYADGFAPTCPVSDDFGHALGDPAEHQLQVALGLRNTGTCTTPAGVSRKSSLSPTSAPVLTRTPLRENRLYRHHE